MTWRQSLCITTLCCCQGSFLCRPSIHRIVAKPWRDIGIERKQWTNSPMGWDWPWSWRNDAYGLTERGFISLQPSLICTVNWLVLRVFANRALGFDWSELSLAWRFSGKSLEHRPIITKSQINESHSFKRLYITHAASFIIWIRVREYVMFHPLFTHKVPVKTQWEKATSLLSRVTLVNPLYPRFVDGGWVKTQWIWYTVVDNVKGRRRGGWKTDVLLCCWRKLPLADKTNLYKGREAL